MTKQTICERSMFTQKKLKGEKRIWRQILHESSLEKILRIKISWGWGGNPALPTE